MRKIIFVSLFLIVIMSLNAFAWGASRAIAENTVTVTIDNSGSTGVFTIVETLTGASVATTPSGCGLTGTTILTCNSDDAQHLTFTYTTTGTGTVSGVIAGKSSGDTKSSQKDITGDSVIPKASSCTPKTCSSEEWNCGTPSDGCGGTLSCGTCTGDLVCAGNVCHVPGPNTELCTEAGDEDADGKADCLDDSCLGKEGPNNLDCCNSNADADTNKVADQCSSVRPFCDVAVGECTDISANVGDTTETIGQRIDSELEKADLNKTQKSWDLGLVSKIAKILKDWFGGK